MYGSTHIPEGPALERSKDVSRVEFYRSSSMGIQSVTAGTGSPAVYNEL